MKNVGYICYEHLIHKQVIYLGRLYNFLYRFGSVQGFFSQFFNTFLVMFFAHKYLWNLSQSINQKTGYLDPESEIYR